MNYSDVVKMGLTGANILITKQENEIAKLKKVEVKLKKAQDRLRRNHLKHQTELDVLHQKCQLKDNAIQALRKFATTSIGEEISNSIAKSINSDECEERLESQDILIKGFTNEMERKDSIIKDREVTIRELEDAIVALKTVNKEISSKNTEYKDLQGMFDNGFVLISERTLDNLKRLLKDKQNQINVLVVDMDKLRQNKGNNVHKIVENLLKEQEGLKYTIFEQRKTIQDLREEIKCLNSDRVLCGTRINDKDNQIARLNTVLLGHVDDKQALKERIDYLNDKLNRIVEVVQ